MNSRDEFEKLFPKAKDLSFSEPENAYLDADENGMCISWNMTAHWEAWQASREQMKKECIEACEKATGIAGHPESWDCIRAIKELE